MFKKTTEAVSRKPRGKFQSARVTDKEISTLVSLDLMERKGGKGTPSQGAHASLGGSEVQPPSKVRTAPNSGEKGFPRREGGFLLDWGAFAA